MLNVNVPKAKKRNMTCGIVDMSYVSPAHQLLSEALQKGTFASLAWNEIPPLILQFIDPFKSSERERARNQGE